MRKKTRGRPPREERRTSSAAPCRECHWQSSQAARGNTLSREEGTLALVFTAAPPSRQTQTSLSNWAPMTSRGCWPKTILLAEPEGRSGMSWRYTQLVIPHTKRRSTRAMLEQYNPRGNCPCWIPWCRLTLVVARRRADRHETISTPARAMCTRSSYSTCTVEKHRSGSTSFSEGFPTADPQNRGDVRRDASLPCPNSRASRHAYCFTFYKPAPVRVDKSCAASASTSSADTAQAGLDQLSGRPLGVPLANVARNKTSRGIEVVTPRPHWPAAAAAPQDDFGPEAANLSAAATLDACGSSLSRMSGRSKGFCSSMTGSVSRFRSVNQRLP